MTEKKEMEPRITRSEEKEDPNHGEHGEHGEKKKKRKISGVSDFQPGAVSLGAQQPQVYLKILKQY